MTAVERLIATAEAEIGYLEKKSNKDLDSKTANAGSNNYTKYNRDLKAWTGVGYINQQWCQAFVCWLFIVAFGVDVAKKLIYTFTNYTPTGSGAFKKKNRYIKRGAGKPKPGDVIYFYSTSKGRIGHVGIVYKVSSTTVYTIEGNTSGASTLVTNGGGVKKKSYSLKSTYIDGYGSVDYSVVSGEPATPVTPTVDGLRYGDEGSAVKDMQKLLLKWNAKCLPEYGADGDFGSETEAAVKAFQKAVGLQATGVYDNTTSEKLSDYLNAKTTQVIEITGGSVNVRTAPSTSDSKVIGVAHKGDKLQYKGQKSKDGWFLVSFKNKDGWVSPKYSRLST